MLSKTRLGMGVGLSLILTIPATLLAQGLEGLWESYLNAGEVLESLYYTEVSWQAENDALVQDISRLEQGEKWYNGWYIKYRLSRKSSNRLSLINTLSDLQNQIEVAEHRRDDALVALRETYEGILIAHEESPESITYQTELIIAIGERLMQESEDEIELPDYKSIVDRSYHSDAVRTLVYTNLLSVLQAKISMLDSLITAKESEENLVHRMSEFHRDLVYQSRAGVEIENAPEVVTSQRRLEGSIGDTYTTFQGEPDASSLNRGFDDQPSSGALGRAPVPTTSGPMRAGEENPLNAQVRDVIIRLQNTRKEYLSLVREIESEITYP